MAAPDASIPKSAYRGAMPEPSERSVRGRLHGLLDEIQSATAAPLTTIPEISKNERLRAAAERLHQSQLELVRTLKEVYPAAVLNPVDRERLERAITEAKAEADEANATAAAANARLRDAVVAATDAGLSARQAARLADQPLDSVNEWRRRSRG